MKTLYYINCFFYLITIVPYLAYYYYIYGLYAQILLGPIQLIFALIFSLKTDQFPTSVKKHLSNYWLAVLISFILMGISYMLKKHDYLILLIISFIVAPMLVATYHVYISYLLKKHKGLLTKRR